MKESPASDVNGPEAKVREPEQKTTPPQSIAEKKERSMVQNGQKAPDFRAPAYFNNEFVSVKLSDYLGKWVVLCFYPGDFTFV